MAVHSKAAHWGMERRSALPSPRLVLSLTTAPFILRCMEWLWSPNKPIMDTAKAPYWHGIRRLMLVWAAIVLFGFIGTYLHPAFMPTGTNVIWALLAVIGLVYSKKQMSFSDRGLRNIFLAWFVIIALGIALSEAVFYIPSLVSLAAYLGAVWLVLMAVGHAITGLLDKRKLYLLTVILQFAAAAFIVMFAAAMPALY